MASLRAEVEKNPAALAEAGATLDGIAAQFPELAGEVAAAKQELFGFSAQAASLKPAVIEAKTEGFFQRVAAVVAYKPPPVRVGIEPDASGFFARIGGIFSAAQAQANRNPIRQPVVAPKLPWVGANGGIMSFAGGGMSLPANATIQPGRGQGLIQWAEGETGGEAFIPLAGSKRKRSKDIWWQTGQRLGVVPMANGGFSSDAPWAQAFEAITNRWQTIFDSSSTSDQLSMATQKRDGLAVWSDEWTKYNNIALEKQRELQREQLESASTAAAALKDIQDNQFDWQYDHLEGLNKLQTAIGNRDSFGMFTDQWVQWAKEVESLQAQGIGTARSVASGGKSSGSAPFYLTVNVNAQGLLSDPSEVGRQVVGAIKSYEQQNGTQWRA
jgi:hypothetical protein